ncbi:MAG: hypothetical protein AAF483_13750 [Planctomycetota bacterium]
MAPRGLPIQKSRIKIRQSELLLFSSVYSGQIGAAMLAIWQSFLVVVICSLCGRCFGQTQEVTTKLVGKNRSELKHGYGNCQRLYPKREPTEQLQLPKLKSAEPLFYEAKLGNAKDCTFTIVLDSTQFDGDYNLAYADLNNDNILDGTSECLAVELGDGSDKDIPVRVKFEIEVDGQPVPYFVDFQAFNYLYAENPLHKIQANLEKSSFRVAELSLGGRLLSVAILDLDSNGLFNDFEKGKTFDGDRILFDFDEDGYFATRDGKNNESFPLSRFHNIDGKWYEIRPSRDGRTVRCTEANPSMGTLECSPLASQVRLYQEGQTLDLKFQEGKTAAIVGKYKLSRLQIKLRGKDRYLRINEEVPVEIVGGQVLQRKFGMGIQVRPMLNLREGEAFPRVKLEIKDSEGFSYTLKTEDWDDASFGVILLDDNGQAIAAYDLLEKEGSHLSLPARYDGKYKLRPLLDLEGLDASFQDLEVEIKRGEIVLVDE